VLADGTFTHGREKAGACGSTCGFLAVDIRCSGVIVVVGLSGSSALAEP
jgi:hypothetical protein